MSADSLALDAKDSITDEKTIEVESQKHADHKPAIRLIPEPSKHPQDPLNWQLRRKLATLAILCLAAFSGSIAGLSGQLAYPVQAKVYHIAPIDSSHSVSAAIAGIAAGPLFFAPLEEVFGRSSLIFWSTLVNLGCQIWGATMTESNDFIPFVMSRLLSGMFGSVPIALGADTIMDVFFLHQRGRAYLAFVICTLLGTIAGPTFGGFIVGRQSWTICFWWTVPLLAVTAICVFLFMEDTTFDRSTGTPRVRMPRGAVARRVALYLPGTKSVPPTGVKKIADRAIAPILIGLSPAPLIIGLFSMICFGWALMISIVFPTFLQTPVAKGGYGFTPTQNAGFTFCEWIGLFTAEAFGYLTNDKIPLWICRRYYNQVWQPELRLYALAVPCVVLPIGLGISGAALEYHLHYMVLALGVYLCGFAALLAPPIAINYVAETYTGYATQCNIILTIFRLSWGIAIPFFISDWVKAVTVGWVFGMAAFFSIFAALMVILLIWKGQTLRQFSFLKTHLAHEERIYE